MLSEYPAERGREGGGVPTVLGVLLMRWLLLRRQRKQKKSGALPATSPPSDFPMGLGWFLSWGPQGPALRLGPLGAAGRRPQDAGGWRWRWWWGAVGWGVTGGCCPKVRLTTEELRDTNTVD